MYYKQFTYCELCTHFPVANTEHLPDEKLPVTASTGALSFTPMRKLSVALARAALLCVVKGRDHTASQETPKSGPCEYLCLIAQQFSSMLEGNKIGKGALQHYLKTA